ncbi:cyclin G [Copidosoma floridanum]|uniref:cyclin G n=1 Tax=Copidosoma floridanum TaxID=29053 RepID=UPI000C6F5847|nr:cyclin G [Copidosoma floridanum]
MESSNTPVPDAVQPLMEQLQEALVLEAKYQPNLQLPSKPNTKGLHSINDNEEVSIEHRDASAYVLRCLKVWFELPSDVLLNAINLMDRFLTKMKARKKHMACISVSAFHIAAVEMAHKQLDVDFLVAISQCKCTSGDLKRMSEVIRNKLEWNPGSQPVTALTFLRVYYLMLHAVAKQLGLGDLYAELVQESELLVYMENVACDGNCASMRQSEVALVLMFMFINDVVNNSLEGKSKRRAEARSDDVNNVVELLRERAPELLKLNAFADDFKKLCKISDANFVATHESVSAILRKYNGQQHTPYKQRLIWKLSSRTARLLRPTDKLTSVLPSIAENPSPKKINKRNRKFARLQSFQGFQGLQNIPGLENFQSRQMHKRR